MKKKILLFVAITVMLVCVFAISTSADNIVPSTSNEYGELTTFDEVIGNTNISQLKDDGTIARTVLYDGTNYYTVPTAYVLTESAKNRGDMSGEMLLLNFSEINTKLGKSFDKNSIIRFEFPSDIAFICRGNENLSNCYNVVEIIVNDELRFWENSDQMKVFTNCKQLTSIDVSGMIIEYPKATFAMFEYCDNLEYVKLPDSYKTSDGFVTYKTDHMFSGCKKLATIENYEGFFAGNTILSYKTFYNCELIPEIKLWDGLQTIEGRAFGNCKSITSIIIPDSVTVIGTTETVFESCMSLKKVVLPKKVALGKYCFEKCTALTDVWMPTEASTFNMQVFGQCGSGLNVTFHFATATNTITVTDTTFNNDPYLTAIGKEGDARIVYNVPLSVKCTDFLGGHELDTNKSNDCAGVCAVCSMAMLAEKPVHNYLTTIAYTNYLANGVKTQTCQNDGCAHKTTPNVVEVAPIISSFKGFSTKEKGNGLTFGYTLNLEAIEEYEAVNDKTLEFGFVVAVQAFLGENAPLNEKGEAASDKVIKASITSEEYTYTGADFKLTGNWEGTASVNGEEIAVKDIMFYMAGYILDGTSVIYINDGATSDKADAVSYNQFAE